MVWWDTATEGTTHAPSATFRMAAAAMVAGLEPVAVLTRPRYHGRAEARGGAASTDALVRVYLEGGDAMATAQANRSPPSWPGRVRLGNNGRHA